jgi:hypothetical protein
MSKALYENLSEYDAEVIATYMRSKGWMCFDPEHERILIPANLIMDLRRLERIGRRKVAARVALKWLSGRIQVDMT